MAPLYGLLSSPPIAPLYGRWRSAIWSPRWPFSAPIALHRRPGCARRFSRRDGALYGLMAPLYTPDGSYGPMAPDGPPLAPLYRRLRPGCARRFSRRENLAQTASFMPVFAEFEYKNRLFFKNNRNRARKKRLNYAYLITNGLYNKTRIQRNYFLRDIDFGQPPTPLNLRQ